MNHLLQEIFSQEVENRKEEISALERIKENNLHNIEEIENKINQMSQEIIYFNDELIKLSGEK